MSPSRARSRALYGIAVPQHGVVSRRQLTGVGVTNNQIRYWVANGRLLKVVTGVYSLGRPAEGPEALMMAGVLAGGPASTVSGTAAAAAWGLGDFSQQLEIVRPQGETRLLQGVPPHDSLEIRIHRGALTESERCFLGPLPVVSPDYVLTSLAGQVSKAALRRHFLDAARFGLITPDRLDRLRSSERRYRGRTRLMHLVDSWDPPKGKLRSMLEAEFRLMLAEQEVPLPEPNQPVGRWEVDCLWRQESLIVELDGRRFHQDPVAQETDAIKTRELRGLGYEVLRFTWEDVTARPEWVAVQILQRLGR